MGSSDSNIERLVPPLAVRPIRILLVGGHASVRESIAVALATQADLEVRECSGSTEAILALRETRPDVVVLKHNAGDGSIDEFVAAMQHLGLTRRVLIFTAWLSRLERRHLVAAGVGGIFRKQRRLGELTAAIRHIAHGGAWFEELPPRPRSVQGQGLSEREQLAANLVAEGLSNKEIAAQMDASEGYVKGLLQRVFLKSGVHSRGQLVGLLMSRRMAAVRSGEGSPPAPPPPQPAGETAAKLPDRRDEPPAQD